MNVKELKDILNKLDDDLDVRAYTNEDSYKVKRIRVEQSYGREEEVLICISE